MVESLRPKYSLLCKIADLLHLSLDELLGKNYNACQIIPELLEIEENLSNAIKIIKNVKDTSKES